MQCFKKGEMRKHVKLRKIFTAFILGAITALSCACNIPFIGPKLPSYEEKDFVFFGFWSPYEFTAESYNLYKQSGLNTLFFTNHSVDNRTSDTLHYLGSNATKKSLDLCKEVGLNAILNYGYWYKEVAEGKSFSDTPFSDYDLYGDYKDIIVGMHIADEPSIDQISDFGDDTLTSDFKSVYDVPYMVNMFPNYAGMFSIGPKGFRHYVQTHYDEIQADFDKNRLLSVDFYPFRDTGFHTSGLACYDDMARVARDNDCKQSYYIQTAIGNEFQESLSQVEIRMQMDTAMAFGADWFGFYCYSTPRTYKGDGSYYPMYEYCMLKPDGTPSPLYYYVQSEIARISAYSSVYLSYDWVKAIPVSEAGGEGSLELLMLGEPDFSNTSLKSATASEDTVIGCFNSDNGEAFMVVNYGDTKTQRQSLVELEFSSGKRVAIYGEGEEPRIVKLKKGKLSLDIPVGAGYFITLL